MADAVCSFPPIVGRRPVVLVLGSMPGVASLRLRQYYGHPHNAFWPIMGELFGASRERSYAQRCARLRRCGVAVWDVLQSCVREGSLDARIEADSIVPNDFAGFLARHRSVRAVFCNGAMAFASYRRHVLPRLDARAAALPLVQLPSTSPAHAGLRLADKLVRWRAVAAAVGD